MSLPQPRTFPFRRNTAVSPFMIPATDQPSKVAIGPLPDGITSFGMVNTYPVHIRLVGTPADGEFNPAAEGVGWIVPPGHFGVYTTQFPKWVSAIAVDRPGFPIKDSSGALLYPQARLELFYGSGS